MVLEGRPAFWKPALPTPLQRLAASAFTNPWLLLTLTCIFWAGNVVAARLAVDQISPMVVVCGRWAIASAVLLVVARKPFLEDWPRLAPHWPRIALMGAFGYTFYHATYFISAHYTTGVNLSIIQGVSPVLVFIGAWVAWRTSVHAMQALGCALTLLGIALVATHGDLATVRDLEFNVGDLGMFIASMVYAAYTLALRNRPKSSALGFFVALALVAFVASIPLLVWEIVSGNAIWPTPRGWLILIYTAIFPSLLAQVFFIRTVELIGPGRATLFYNLVPVLGALFSVAMLHEDFETYHAIALALVIGGILMAERLRR
jgi:drug/metabolite transporter (DMT)-like permease